MKLLKHSLLALALGALFTACYEDEGNYDYRTDIHDISVKLNSVYGIRKSKEAMTYTFTPEITTATGDKSKLGYTWLMARGNSGIWDTISTAETASILLDPDAADFAYKYQLRLYVTDSTTGGLTMVPTALEITKPYAFSWLVLHEQDNHAELGSVEYVGNDMVVNPTAYTSERGASLTGRPLILDVYQRTASETYQRYTANSQVYLATTNADESGLLNQANNFERVASWQDLIYPDQQADFSLADGAGSSSGYSSLLLTSKGKVYRNFTFSPSFFAFDPGSTLEGNYYITKVSSGPHTGLAYDSIGHRILHLSYSLSNSQWRGFPASRLEQIGYILPIRNAANNAVEPTKLPTDETFVNFVNGYWYSRENPAIWQRFSAYAYTLGSGNRSHVYVYRYRALTAASDATPPLANRYTFTTPEGITANTPMTSSYEYNNILFYGAGNKVYKLDCTTGQTTVIYSHEDSNAKAVQLRMAVDGYAENAFFTGNSFGYSHSRTLGIAFNTSDGQGELIVLQLNTAGRIDTDQKFPSTQRHRGFGPITSIAFI